MLYFAYGMNTNLKGMANRCPNAVSLGAARLLGYRFRFAGPADVQPDRNEYVDGVLWEITEDCLHSLDMLEGYPYYYNRRYRQVEFEGKIVRALVYYMNPGHKNHAPSQGYFDMVLEGYCDHGVPTEQLYEKVLL